MKPFTFRGFMVPVFTIFNDDEQQSVNYDAIDPYAKFIKGSELEAVLVHGTAGEGTSQTTAERMMGMEKWSEACKKYGLTMMVQVSGTCVNDSIKLAQHAEECGVDALLLLPELYFKPKTIEQLVDYIKLIADKVPQMPIFYYHAPIFTGLSFNMPDFMDLAEKHIPNFKGIKYTSDDLHLLPIEAATKNNRTVFMGCTDFKLLDAMRLGHDSFLLTTQNIRPELSQMVKEKHLSSGKGEKEQAALVAFVEKVIEAGGNNWVVAMKKEFNKSGTVSFKVGVPRKPL